MKTYRGKRIDQATVEVTVDSGYGPTPLRHFVLHSPTGMEWGYGGSGPADTALAILADLFGERPTRLELARGEPSRCVRHHMNFKSAFVCGWGAEWSITSEEIIAWLAAGSPGAWTPEVAQSRIVELVKSAPVTTARRWRVVNTWNGGAGGRKVVYESTERGDAGHNQCFMWIHHHTPFSFDEATKRQGYVVEVIEEV